MRLLVLFWFLIVLSCLLLWDVGVSALLRLLWGLRLGGLLVGLGRLLFNCWFLVLVICVMVSSVSSGVLVHGSEHIIGSSQNMIV